MNACVVQSRIEMHNQSVNNACDCENKTMGATKVPLINVLL